MRNPYILNHAGMSRFFYADHSLNGLLLEPMGIKVNQNGSVNVYFCAECQSALGKCKLPHLALNNGLYRGELPEDLKDITWVEEMACSLYRTTAHVARLYGSSSEENPLYIHGNTCAHPMQTTSHAKKLPRTPGDVNDLITVVFVRS